MAGTILIVTEDGELLDDLLRLCAAANAPVEVAHSLPPDQRGAALAANGTVDGTADGGPPSAEWAEATLVLVGDDRARRPIGARRPGVLLVGREPADPGVWQRAVGLGAEQVLLLPGDEARLADRIADAVEGAGRRALSVGVMGGRGGAGASTLACALALAAVRRGEPTTLVDADPCGGGLDVPLGAERAAGLRWPGLAESRGRVGSAALAEALPTAHGITLLSWDRGEPVTVPTAAESAVLTAARRGGGVLVVDLPRRVDATTNEPLRHLDLCLLLVPTELRATAAARQLARRLRPTVADLRVAVRGPGPCPGVLDAAETARLLDLPLVGEVPTEHGLTAAVESGTPPGAAQWTPLARFCSAFWARALPRPAGGVNAT